MERIDLAKTSLRELNQFLHHEVRKKKIKHVEIVNPDGAHSIAAGVDAPVKIDVRGHTGYYCAGMNKQAEITVQVSEAGTATPPAMPTLERVGEGVIRFRYQGTPGANHSIQRSTDLVTWITLASGLGGATGGGTDGGAFAAGGVAGRFFLPRPNHDAKSSQPLRCVSTGGGAGGAGAGSKAAGAAFGASGLGRCGAAAASIPKSCASESQLLGLFSFSVMFHPVFWRAAFLRVRFGCDFGRGR